MYRKHGKIENTNGILVEIILLPFRVLKKPFRQLQLNLGLITTDEFLGVKVDEDYIRWSKKAYEQQLFKIEVVEDNNAETGVFFGIKKHKKVEVAQALVQYFKENRTEAAMMKRFLELAENESDKVIC